MAGTAEQAAALVDEAKNLLEHLEAAGALKAAREALEIFRELGDQAGAAAALRPLLAAQVEAGELKPDEAHKLVKEEATKVKKVAKDGRKADALLQAALAEVHLMKGEADKALKVIADALAFFVKEEDTGTEAELLCNIVTPAHMSRTDSAKATSSANQALAIAQKGTDAKDEARAWLAVAQARLASGSDDALQAAQKVRGLFNGLGNRVKEVTSLLLISQAHLKRGDAQAALASARDGLAIATEIPSGLQAGALVEAIVEAHILSSDPERALKDAEAELSTLQAVPGLQRGVVGAMSAVVLAKSTYQGVDAGLEAVKGFVEKLREAGDKRGEVRMLHRLACMSPFPDVAMNTAQAALALSRQVGEAKEEKAIKKTLTDLYVARGKIDKAPNRKEALALLQDLARELEKKDGDKFDDVSKSLEGYWNALTQSDIEGALHRVIGLDPPAYLEFLKAHNTNMGPEDTKPQHQLRFLPIPILYYGFRVSGLGYGPRFRCVTPSYKVMWDQQGWGVVQLQDCSDDWERELGYSSSMLDCCLQSGSAMGYPL